MTAAVRSDGAASPRPQLWRVSDRAGFSSLRSGRRVRRGAVSLTFVGPIDPDSVGPPRAAFAIGRALGGAVVRNRIRRRLRAALRELQAAERLPAGTYLLGGSPDLAEMPWSALVAEVDRAVVAATAGTAA